MSPLFFGAAGCAGLTVGGVITLISWRVKSNLFRGSAIGAALLAFLPLMLLILQALAWLVTSYRYDVSPQAVPGIQPPATATAVSYMYAPLMGTLLAVEFKCSEADFQTWAEARGWHLVPITAFQQIVSLTRRSNRSGGLKVIRVPEGLRFDTRLDGKKEKKEHDNGSGTVVLYDRTTGTGFINVHTF